MDDLDQACTDGNESRISQLLVEWKDTLEVEGEKKYLFGGHRTDRRLILAATGGYLEIVKCLMEPGSITNIQTVDAAIRSRHIDLLDYLMLYHPWEINRRGSNHYTPALG